MNTWQFMLESWVIASGAYGEFRRGDLQEFSVEFSYDRIFASSSNSFKVSHTHDYSYALNAQVIYLVSGLTVIDFGIRAVSTLQPLPEWASVGSYIHGDVELMVDSRQYAMSESAPPLAYKWGIEQILLAEAPLVEIAHDGNRVIEFDRSNARYREVSTTNDSYSRYPCIGFILNCVLLNNNPVPGRL